MMTWLAWSAIALATLVAAVNAWMTWQKLSGAARTPEQLENPQEPPSGRRSKVDHEPIDIPGDLDERGYLYTMRIRADCDAAICLTPFGARIVAGTNRLEEPQYAWDYTSVVLAHDALALVSFETDRERGVVVDEAASGSYPAEPRNYVRRWKYTADGQMQRF